MDRTLDRGEISQLSKDKRLKEIVNLLKQNRHVEIKELRKKLNVSEMTVRRDLNQLADDNVRKADPGGRVHPAGGRAGRGEVPD